MSAVISFKAKDAIIIVADAAVYDDHGVLVDIKSKVRRSNKTSIAVAGRGSEVWGDHVAEVIIGWAETCGVDEALATLAEAVPIWKLRDDFSNVMEITVAAITNKGEPRHVLFHNVKTRRGGQIEPLKLHELGNSFLGCSPGLDEVPIPAPRQLRPGESAIAYLSERGPQLLQHHRDLQVGPSLWCRTSRPRHVVGGFAEMTVIDREGVECRILHDWKDRKGELIDPDRNRFLVPEPSRPPAPNSGKVIAIGTGRSRQQRRAAERAGRKRVA